MSRSDYKNLYEGYLDSTGYNNRNIRENYSNYDNCYSNLIYYSPDNAKNQNKTDKMYFYFSDKDNSKNCENKNILTKSDPKLKYIREITPTKEDCCIHDLDRGGEIYDKTAKKFKIPTKFYFCNDFTCDKKSANKNNLGPNGLQREYLSNLHPVCRNNDLFNGTTKEITCPDFIFTETNPITECCNERETYDVNSKNFTITYDNKGLDKCKDYTCPSQSRTRNIEPSKDCENKKFVLYEGCTKPKGSSGTVMGTQKTITRSFIKNTNYQCGDDITSIVRNRPCPLKDNPTIKNV